MSDTSSAMMVIDFHVHTFPEKIAARALETLSAKSRTSPYTDGTLSGLLHSMGEARISYAVLQPVATKPEQVTRINDNAIALNGTDKIFSFGAVHPDFCGVEGELSRLARAGIRGVKIHPVYQGVNIDDERYVKILACAGELGLYVMIHAGYDIGFPGNDAALPVRILRAMSEAGNFRVILAHMGGWKCWREARELFAGREGLYVDTAFSSGNVAEGLLDGEEFVKMIHAFGAEHVLFGTDSPWASQSECVKEFASLPLNDDEKKLILFGNARKILVI